MPSEATHDAPRSTSKGSGGSRPAAQGERTIKRSTFSPEQLHVLENAFSVNPLPNLALRHNLAEQLGLSPRTVQVWFQNRRQKVKKLQMATGNVTSNDTSSAGGDHHNHNGAHGSGSPQQGMRRNSSTGSFEILNAEFEKLGHSHPSDGQDEGSPRARGHSPTPHACDYWSPRSQLLEPAHNLSTPLHSLLDSRMESCGGNSGGQLQLSEYRQQLMQRLAAVDPTLNVGGGPDALPGSKRHLEQRLAHDAAAHDYDGLSAVETQQYADTLDAAANLLLFSATAAFLHGSAHGQPHAQAAPHGQDLSAH